MKTISTFGQRIKKFREDNNYKLSEMENLTGVPAQTINRYELEQRVPKVDLAAHIADKLKINPLWLFGYDVEMTLESSRTSNDKNQESTLFSEHESKVLTAYRNKPTMQQAVDKLLEVTPEECDYIKFAARGRLDIDLTDEQVKALTDSADKAPNRARDKNLF